MDNLKGITDISKRSKASKLLSSKSRRAKRMASVKASADRLREILEEDYNSYTSELADSISTLDDKALEDSISEMDAEINKTCKEFYMGYKLATKAEIAEIICEIADSCSWDVTTLAAKDGYCRMTKNMLKTCLAMLYNGAEKESKDLFNRDICYRDWSRGSISVLIIQNDIVELTGLSQTSASDVLHRLCRAGIIERDPGLRFDKESYPLYHRANLYNINVTALRELLSSVSSSLSQSRINSLILDLFEKRAYLGALSNAIYRVARDVTSPIRVDIDDLTESGEYALGAMREVICDMQANDAFLLESAHYRFVEHGLRRMTNDLCSTENEEHDPTQRYDMLYSMLGTDNIGHVDVHASIYTLSANLKARLEGRIDLPFAPFATDGEDFYRVVTREIISEWNKTAAPLRADIRELLHRHNNENVDVDVDELADRINECIPELSEDNIDASRPLVKKVLMSPYMSSTSGRYADGERSLSSLAVMAKSPKGFDYGYLRRLESLLLSLDSSNSLANRRPANTRYRVTLRNGVVLGKKNEEKEQESTGFDASKIKTYGASSESQSNGSYYKCSYGDYSSYGSYDDDDYYGDYDRDPYGGGSIFDDGAYIPPNEHAIPWGDIEHKRPVGHGEVSSLADVVMPDEEETEETEETVEETATQGYLLNVDICPKAIADNIDYSIVAMQLLNEIILKVLKKYCGIVKRTATTSAVVESDAATLSHSSTTGIVDGVSTVPDRVCSYEDYALPASSIFMLESILVTDMQRVLRESYNVRSCSVYDSLYYDADRLGFTQEQELSDLFTGLYEIALDRVVSIIRNTSYLESSGRWSRDKILSIFTNLDTETSLASALRERIVRGVESSAARPSKATRPKIGRARVNLSALEETLCDQEGYLEVPILHTE